MNKIIVSILLVVLPLSLQAQDLPYREVSQKFQQDKEAFAQFQYLGTLNCLETRFISMHKDDDRDAEMSKYSQAYDSLFMQLNALPALFSKGRLKNVFVKFEQQHYPKNEHTSWNKINECSKVYSSNAARQLFVQFVNNPKNYNYTLYDEDYGYDEQTLRAMMSDYLRLGEIDECRYENGECPLK